MGDLDAAAQFAGADGGNAAKLGITGFCWGGRIVWLYAAHNPRLKAGVACYGRVITKSTELQPKNPIDLVPAIKAPVLGLYRRAARVGSDEQLLAIRDQVDFLCLMAGRSSKGRRAFLTVLRDGLGTLNPPPGAPAAEQPGSPVGR